MSSKMGILFLWKQENSSLWQIQGSEIKHQINNKYMFLYLSSILQVIVIRSGFTQYDLTY